MSVYLHLFHGRDTDEEDMEDMGYDGPTLGPFPFVHTTYGNDLKIGDEAMSFIKVSPGGCIMWEGKFYGDWSVHTIPPAPKPVTRTPEEENALLREAIQWMLPLAYDKHSHYALTLGHEWALHHPIIAEVME